MALSLQCLFNCTRGIHRTTWHCIHSFTVFPLYENSAISSAVSRFEYFLNTRDKRHVFDAYSEKRHHYAHVARLRSSGATLYATGVLELWYQRRDNGDWGN